MISTEQWPRFTELVDRALALPQDERDRFLVDECADEPELLAEARALVALDSKELARMVPATPAEHAPRSIGPYEVRAEIGRGGMASVFLAMRRDGSDPRPVAIKLLHRGFEGHDIGRRFYREGEILSRFRHPHIAALYGSGTSDDGRPYLVMEAVEGEPIDRYCEGLPIDAVLRLVRAVCAAVAYAHRNLVVHRDLKPSNILITAAGEPKLVDFGISKLLDPESRRPATVTRQGWQLLTPQYASPEQIRGEPATTSCDVYGLGVVLYELLTGCRPFDGTGEALRRKILDEAPVRPSQAIGPGGHDRRQLVGDLDNIVSTALEKDPKLRYGSVEQLDADLERYATDQPVLARSATWSYRLGKLLRRQRRWVAGLVLGVVALVGVAVERERNRQDLERQRDQAIAVQDFLVEVFDQADPRLGHDGRLDVRDVLDEGVARVESLDDQPRLQAEFSQVLGRVYMNLGLFEQARPLLERSFALHLEHHGDDSAEVAAMRDLRGQLFDAIGEHEAAAEQFELALRWRRQERPRNDIAMTAVLNNLALNYRLRGQQAEAVALARENLSLRRQIWGDDHIEAAIGYNNLGYVLLGDPAADQDEIRRLFEHGLALRRQHLGDTHTDVAVSLNNLASVLIAQGDFAGARVHMQDAFEIWRQFLDDDHPEMLTARLNIVAVLDFTGELAEALRQLEELMPKLEQHFGPESIQVQSGRDRLATLRAKVRGVRAREPASDEPSANHAPPSPESDR